MNRDITKVDIMFDHSAKGRCIFVYRAGRIPRQYKFTEQRYWNLTGSKRVFQITQESRILTAMIRAK